MIMIMIIIIIVIIIMIYYYYYYCEPFWSTSTHTAGAKRQSFQWRGAVLPTAGAQIEQK